MNLRFAAIWIIRTATPVLILFSGAPVRGEPLAAAVFDWWGGFTRISSEMASPRTIEKVRIGRAATSLGGGGREFWVMERTVTVVDGRQERSSVSWADSRSCASLIPSLTGLAELEAFEVQPPGLSWPKGRETTGTPLDHRRIGDDGIVHDGGTFDIEGRGHWPQAGMQGSIILRSGAGTPASAWVQKAFEALKSCWS